MLKNLDNLSDKELRSLLAEQSRLQNLSREDLLKEAMSLKLDKANSTGLPELKVHPLSSLAISTASPEDAYKLGMKSMLPMDKFIFSVLGIIFLSCGIFVSLNIG